MLQRVVWILWGSLLITALPVISQQVQPDLDRSEQLFIDGRFEKAQAILDSVAMITTKKMQPAIRLLIASQSSKIGVFQGIMSRDRTKYENALAILRPHRKVLSDVHHARVRANFTLALGYAHLFNTHISPAYRDTSIVQFREANLLYIEARDLAGQALARALEIMLRFTRQRANKDMEGMLDLIPEFEAEIAFSHQARDPIALAYNQRHLAAIYREAANELDKALNLYQASLETRLQMGFRPFLPASYFSVGDVMEDLGKIEPAIDMYEKSMKAADRVGFHRYQFNSRIKLGELLQKVGKLTLARSHYEDALQVAQKVGSQEEVSLARNKLEKLN